MPTRRIGDLPGSIPCRHPEHDPPKHICWPSGLYEHICPECHATQLFAIERPTWTSDTDDDRKWIHRDRLRTSWIHE